MAVTQPTCGKNRRLVAFNLSSMRLENKVIIITGSCTGIGKAIATRAVQEGAKVVVHGLDREPGQALVEMFGEDKAVLHIEDLTHEGAPARLVELALSKFGKLDAVVNNAALVKGSDVHSTTLPFLRQLLEVNTLAPFALIQAALPFLTESRGCVLNIGSVNAYCGEPNLLAYSMSKGALQTLTRNLGDALHRTNHVRVNQLNPGWVLTENEIRIKREEGFSDDWETKLPDIVAPAGRILRPEEVATAAIYWLSDESGPISAQVVELEQHPLIGRNPPKDLSVFAL
jgi:NAD(P)-dependent dehydrogenase (short-subunit alcohol dehydrogenase family)